VPGYSEGIEHLPGTAGIENPFVRTVKTLRAIVTISIGIAWQKEKASHL
jgi:hypothetical protein